MDNKQLVAKLRGQHDVLVKQFAECREETKKEKPDCAKLSSMLDKMSHTLGEHLALENGVFYPELLKYLKIKKMPTEGMDRFFREMTVIEDFVIAFIKKYSGEDALRCDTPEFANGLEQMASLLTVRMETEDECAYVYLE